MSWRIFADIARSFEMIAPAFLAEGSRDSISLTISWMCAGKLGRCVMLEIIF